VPTDTGISSDTAAPSDTGTLSGTLVTSAGGVIVCGEGAGGGGASSPSSGLSRSGSDTGAFLAIGATALVAGVGLSLLAGRRNRAAQRNH
jgi:hypothetical protein